ncbi:hypothetical protein BGZ98_002487 [Dissophora globulifera]|nr:hypothetical protein BGZ98_002487 [Dissophora globulifera]
MLRFQVQYQYPSGAIQYQFDNFFQSTNTTTSPLTECVSLFVEDIVFKATNGQQNTGDFNCGYGCCLTFFQTNAFYKSGVLDKGYFITDVLKGVSAVLTLILAVSYLVLLDKLQHPSNLILFTAFATAIFSAAVALSCDNPKRV